jgi:hypothetical protein
MTLRYFLTMIVIISLPLIGLLVLFLHNLEKVYDYRKRYHVNR